MDSIGFKKVQQRIKIGESLDFGSIFSRSFELFQKVWLQGFVTLLLTFVCILPFYILFYLPFIIAGITDSEAMRSEELPLAVAVPMLILMPILLLVVTSIGLMFNAAFLRICKQKDLKEPAGEEYFYYFKKRFLSKAVMLSLILLGLSLLGALLCGIGLFYMIVPLSLFPSFLAFDEELSASEITKASFTLGNKNWLGIFGLVLLMGLLAQLGVLLCLVGALFTAMLSKVPVYYIYKDGVGFENETVFS